MPERTGGPTPAQDADRRSVTGCSLFAFSFMRWYPAATCVLFLAGFLELSFSSMTQALVQLNAPDTIRGRVMGLFSMSAMGSRAFSGVTVGLLGRVTNTHVSLAVSALAFVAVAGLLLLRRPRPGVHAG